MKSTIDGLTPKEKKTLALWYETEAFKAFTKLVDLERIELAKDSLDQIEILNVRYLSGQAEGLKKLIISLKAIYKTSLKD